MGNHAENFESYYLNCMKIFFRNIAKIGIVLRIMMRQIHSFCCILSIQAYFMNFVLVIFWQKWLVILFGNFHLSKTKDLCLRCYPKFWDVVYLAESNIYLNSVIRLCFINTLSSINRDICTLHFSTNVNMVMCITMLEKSHYRHHTYIIMYFIISG